MSSFSRLRNAQIPWSSHLLFILSLVLVPTPHIRTALLVYAFVTFLLDTEYVLAAFRDPSEPPLIPHPYLPFLGHVIGMFFYGASYFSLVNRSTQHPIFTLQTLTARTIVVIDPALAGQVQKASRNTSFYGMILEVTKRLVGFDETSMGVIRENLDDENGTGEGLMVEAGKMVHEELSPGPGLNEMQGTQLEKFADLLDDFVPSGGNGKEVEISLMDFVKRIFTTANAYTIYGPKNPFAVHPELVQKFWDYEAGMIGVMADVLPWVTARKAWTARRDINVALEEFVREGWYRSAAPIIQKRVAINLKHGLTVRMSGRAELILLFGIIGNAVPTTFWVLSNIFARPELLERIREETSRAVLCHRGVGENGSRSKTNPKENTINVTTLKTECPLLVSTYRETLRQIANLSSVRLVKYTHSITAPGHRVYTLKGSSIVQIASGVIHALPSVWGEDASHFDPERFISEVQTNEQFSDAQPSGASDPTKPSSMERTATNLPRNVPSAAYRAFGGGSVICPGRHFAQSEILGFVALCVHMLDIVGSDGYAMSLPKRDDGRIPLSVMKPDKEPIVKIRRRPGEEDVVWKLEL